MKRKVRIANLGGARAYILHRPHPTVQALERQLRAIGLTVVQCWPELPAEAIAADFLFFDVDQGFDEQFPWRPGESPMPMIALIGSSSTARIAIPASGRGKGPPFVNVGLVAMTGASM